MLGEDLIGSSLLWYSEGVEPMVQAGRVAAPSIQTDRGPGAATGGNPRREAQQ
jgi:hypothetical protein